MASRNRTIKVDVLARVEGEGGLYVRIRNRKVTDVQLKIFEPPRFFEAFLRGRDFREAPDITARICGICPVAYQMSAVHAMENALGVNMPAPLRDLRRLLYCGEWIESHALHITLLHAPDFLGYDDGVQMAKDHRAAVERGLGIKKIGNEILSVIGGREVHPINVKVGGFYRVPTRAELSPLHERLCRARDDAIAMARWTADFNFPELEKDYNCVALQPDDQYPFNDGPIASTSGLKITVGDFADHFTEEHVSRSNALHATMEGRGAYLVGPIARYNLNFSRLSLLAQEVARACRIGTSVRNPFKSVIVRAVEVVYACDEAIRLIENYQAPAEPAVPVATTASAGAACTEAPRGLLYHRYRMDAAGTIVDAQIVPPTSQNQKTMESDLWSFVDGHVDLPKDALQWSCEQVVRNHDPCISCATHFINLDLDRDDGY